MKKNNLEVWLDTALVSPAPIKIGQLTHDRGSIRFNYAKAWLLHPLRFDIDPELSLDDAVFHPDPLQGNFGVFLDSSPDRWGQTLMKRREAIEAKDEARIAKTLYAWDYLIGVQDHTRQGALRFKYPDTELFLDSHKLSAPPVVELAHLEKIAFELSNKKMNDLDTLRQWLRVLVAPGASLGGARPKANFTNKDGSLWIAKFPAKDDDRDIGAWEMLAHQLALAAKINTPPAKLLKLGGNYSTFASKRFDRIDRQRVHYASAMTMLGQTNSDNSSYIDIAYFIMTRGGAKNVKEDLTQLFRRVAFNIVIGNRDDHLRNHGFILSKEGWRLSPAFDVNPNIDKGEHALNIDINDNRPELESLMNTAEYYELSINEAQKNIAEIITAIQPWEKIAKSLNISRSEIELMRPAFSSGSKSNH